MLESNYQSSSDRIVDEIDRARAQEYALLATLYQTVQGLTLGVFGGL
jgi:hypothetical protein